MKIIIQTNADFTPKGKRRVRLVKGSRGQTIIRGYVSGKRYCVFDDPNVAYLWVHAGQ